MDNAQVGMIMLSLARIERYSWRQQNVLHGREPFRVLKEFIISTFGESKTLLFAKDDYMEFDAPMPTMGLEEGKRVTHLMKVYAARGREDYCWYCMSEQKPDEVLIVRHWDINREGDSVGPGGAMPSRVKMEDPRVSLELRFLATW